MTKTNRTPIRTARTMSTRQIADRIREALQERTGETFYIRAASGGVKLKPLSYRKRVLLRDALKLNAVPMRVTLITKPETLISYLHRAEGHAA